MSDIRNVIAEIFDTFTLFYTLTEAFIDALKKLDEETDIIIFYTREVSNKFYD